MERSHGSSARMHPRRQSRRRLEALRAQCSVLRGPAEGRIHQVRRPAPVPRRAAQPLRVGNWEAYVHLPQSRAAVVPGPELSVPRAWRRAFPPIQLFEPDRPSGRRRLVSRAQRTGSARGGAGARGHECPVAWGAQAAMASGCSWRAVRAADRPRHSAACRDGRMGPVLGMRPFGTGAPRRPHRQPSRRRRAVPGDWRARSRAARLGVLATSPCGADPARTAARSSDLDG